MQRRVQGLVCLHKPSLAQVSDSNRREPHMGTEFECVRSFRLTETFKYRGYV